jgi:hypothetical protein
MRKQFLLGNKREWTGFDVDNPYTVPPVDYLRYAIVVPASEDIYFVTYGGQVLG